MFKKILMRLQRFTSAPFQHRNYLLRGTVLVVLALLFLIGSAFFVYQTGTQRSGIKLEIVSSPSQPEASASGQQEELFTNTGVSGYYLFFGPYGEDSICQLVSLNLDNGQFDARGRVREGIRSATLSRGGDKIAYFFGPDGGESLAVLDLFDERTRYYPLPEIPTEGGRLVWSPDGGAIAYIGVGKVAVWGSTTPRYYSPKNLYEIKVSDGESRVLYRLGSEFDEKPCQLVSWLSSNEMIFTGGFPPQSVAPIEPPFGEGLYLLNLATGRVVSLTGDFFYHVSIDPTHRLIAYTTLNYEVDPRQESLKVLDVDSRSLVVEKTYVQEIRQVDIFFQPGLVWSSDGDALFFSRTDFSKQKEEYDFWRVIEKLDLATKQTETLLSDSGLDTSPVAEIGGSYLLIYKNPPPCKKISDEEKRAGYVSDPSCFREGFRRSNNKCLYLYNRETGEKTEYPDFDAPIGWSRIVDLAK